MSRRARLKPQSPQLVRQTGLGVILRALRVWVPKRTIPRLGALSVVNIRAKRTQFFDCGLRIADRGLRTALRRDACPAVHCLGAARAGCTNKPNWPEPIVQNEPNSARLGPVWVTRGRKMQNEPNVRRADMPPPFQYSIIPAFQSGADCAKQTQFPHPRGLGTRGVVQTNPIPALVPIRRSAFPGGRNPTPQAGAIAPNKPNSARPAGKPGPWEGRTCKTNPISGVAGWDEQRGVNA